MTREEALALLGADTAQFRAVSEAFGQSERQCRQERDRLFALFEDAPVFMSVLEGPELRVVMVNRRTREAFAGSLGQTVREIYAEGAEGDPVVTALERVYATGVPETVRALPAGGMSPARLYTRSYVPLRDEGGRVHGILAVGYEVTEEVRAEQSRLESEGRDRLELQRLSAILEEVPVMITALEGPDLRIVMMNRLTRQGLAGRDPLGLSLGDVLSPTNPSLLAARRVYETGVSETFEYISADVEGFVGGLCSQTVVRVGDERGATRRILTLSVDLTEHRRAREALEVQARDLEAARQVAVQASRTKDEFLAMLGHELRNPLAPILLTLEAMSAQGQGSSDVELLQRQVRHLVRLVDDLLDVSRIERRLIELRCREIDLAMVVHRALEMASPLVEKRQQRISSDLSPAAVHGDPDRLAQVVANLITNAAKYSDRGSRICIRTERSNGLARISVADDGVGIAPEMITRVFDTFVQQPQTLARSDGGLGLGLSIVRGLVEAHGGTVSAQSDGLGKGSTFVITLPALEGPGAGAEIVQPPGCLAPALEAKRILVVDDSRDAASALRNVLEDMGQIVLVAHDGPAALQQAAAFQPQIGLLDIGLPGMDGYQLAAALRAAHDLRLFAITGYGQARDIERSRAAGFDEHLVKPVDREQIARLLRRLRP
jgi:signal transduction histidine kinase/CheY-like chemotaxis protein